MGGMKSLFTKIIPIVMLVCFICLGITHAFGHFNAETGQSNITYISKETIETGTQENPYELTYYELDVNAYMQGMDNNILERATTNVIDTETYLNTLDSFNAIWENGYQFLDGIHTIINSVILIINTMLTIINFVIVPIRIIAGLLLTGFSLVGINIQNNGIITTTLNTLLDLAAIPLINPVYNNDEQILNTTWLCNNDIRWWYDEKIINTTIYNFPFDIDFNFNSPSGGNYNNLRTSYETIDNVNHTKIWYRDTDGYEILVYDNGWIYQDSKTIIISNNNNFNDGTDNINQLKTFMDVNASQIVN